MVVLVVEVICEDQSSRQYNSSRQGMLSEIAVV